MMKHQVNPIQALACTVMSLSAMADASAIAYALPQPAQAMPQMTISITPENITPSLCLLHQQPCTYCARRPPRPEPPGGSR